MNRNQTEFSGYWDKVADTAFYQVVKITENSSITDKIFDNQRDELSKYIREEINRTFFDTQMRPRATVWLESLKKDYPAAADRFEKYIINCEIPSKGNENIFTIAAGGTAAVAGAAVRKKHSLTSKLLVLGGAAVAGCKIASGLSVDASTLQKEVKKQFEVWKTSLLNILANCNDMDSIQAEDEE